MTAERWAVLTDGGLYRVLDHDDAGAVVESADTGETWWTPASDVDMIGTADEAEAYADSWWSDLGDAPVAPALRVPRRPDAP